MAIGAAKLSVIEPPSPSETTLLASAFAGPRVLLGEPNEARGLFGSAMSSGPRVIETTERRVRYYGFVLEYPEAAVLVAMILGSGGFWPEEADEIRKILVTVFRLPAELMDLVDRRPACPRSRRRAARATMRPQSPNGRRDK